MLSRFALLGLLALLAGRCGAQYTHSWDAPVSRMSWVDFTSHHGLPGGSVNLTAGQLRFIAENYAIVSMEKCFGNPRNETLAVFDEYVPMFKHYNPDLKVIFYWNADNFFPQCYGTQAPTVAAHPEWLATQDSGAPIPGLPTLNDTIAEQREWWVSVAAERKLADGYFVDGAGTHIIKGVSPDRNSALTKGLKLKLDELRAAVHPRPVFGNTITAYYTVPNYDLDFLSHMDGACSEHVGAFEAVMPGENALNVTLTSGLLSVLWKVASKMNKTVLTRTWPGPVTGPITVAGPSWNHNSPNTTAERIAGELKYVDFSAGMWLVTATEYTYWSYNWWYSFDNGVAPCPTCEAPPGWYPIFNKIPGKPKGPALRWTSDGVLIGEIGSEEDFAETARAAASGRQAAGVYTREFANVNVSINLGTMSATLDWHNSGIRA